MDFMDFNFGMFLLVIQSHGDFLFVGSQCQVGVLEKKIESFSEAMFFVFSKSAFCIHDGFQA